MAHVFRDGIAQVHELTDDIADAELVILVIHGVEKDCGNTMVVSLHKVRPANVFNVHESVATVCSQHVA